ncbi:MAG TPA: hypothetical protein VHS53_05070, partial [Mucilaginibacter sp.]|nr:hypothetical protein [Mucilaginibacter sp.]
IDHLLDIGLQDKQLDIDFYFLKAAYLHSKDDDAGAYSYLTKSKKLFQKTTTKYSLAFWVLFLWIEINYKRNKNQAYRTLEKAESSRVVKFVNEPFLIFFRIFIEIWNGNYGIALEHLPRFISDRIDQPEKKDLIRILLLLMAKNQHHILLNIFEEYDKLKEYYKPIYFALMYHLEDEYPNEYLKMGEELKQPVEDILKEVKEMAVKYA